MRVWLSCFLVLFAIAEFFEWAGHFTLPLPIYILGGAFLAIASNYDKLTIFSWQEPTASSNSVVDSANNSPTLSNLTSQQPPKPISFTINRSDAQIKGSELKDPK